MCYLERNRPDIEKTLKGFRFDFSRAATLEEAFKDNLSSYIVDALSEEPFEARGVLVTGPSRAGKTKEIQHLLNEFHAAEVMMPNGRPAKIVTCILKGVVTWKDLGKKVLTTLGYDLKGNLSQNEVWDRVSIQSELQNVIGIHFDECQHMFRDTTRNTNEVIIDSFKAVMKDSRYPMMLILSGVPKLEEFINAPSVAAEQIRPLLTSVRFANIHLPDDEETMVDLLIELCNLGGVGYENLETEEFIDRLAFSANWRWGLVIELIKKAILCCRKRDGDQLLIDDFSSAFAKRTGTSERFTPFNAADYERKFDPGRLNALMEKDAQ